MELSDRQDGARLSIIEQIAVNSADKEPDFDLRVSGDSRYRPNFIDTKSASASSSLDLIDEQAEYIKENTTENLEMQGENVNDCDGDDHATQEKADGYDPTDTNISTQDCDDFDAQDITHAPGNELATDSRQSRMSFQDALGSAESTNSEETALPAKSFKSLVYKVGKAKLKDADSHPRIDVSRKDPPTGTSKSTAALPSASNRSVSNLISPTKSARTLSQSFGSLFSGIKNKSKLETPTTRISTTNLIRGQASAGSFAEDDNYVTDAFKHITNAVLKTSLPTLLNIKWKERTMVLKIKVEGQVEELIIEIMEYLGVTCKSDQSDQEFASEFKAAKFDSQNPVTLVWLDHKLPAEHYSLQDGDRLIIVPKDERFKVVISVPQFNNETELEVTHTETVENVIDRVKPLYDFPSNEACGLYCSSKGMWLNLHKSFDTYDLSNEEVQLRPLVNEFAIRIQLDDFQQKFAIKVLPSFKVHDVYSIIRNQIKNRKLELPLNRNYSLFIEELQIWMNPDMELTFYPSLREQNLHYKTQEELCSVKYKDEVFEFYFDEKATVNDLISKVIVKEDERRIYSLYNSFDEIYNLQQTIWQILDDSSVDNLLIEETRIPVIIRCNWYDKQDIKFMLNPEKTISAYIDRICRKLGILQSQVVKVLAKSNNSRNSSSSLKSKETAEEVEDIGAVYDLEVQLDDKLGDLVANSNSLVLYFTISALEKEESENNRGIANSETKLLLSLGGLVNLISEGDQNLVDAFLMTYSSFASAEEVINELKKKYIIRNVEQLSWQQFQKWRNPMELRICNFILQWVKKYQYDFSGANGPDKIKLVNDFANDFIVNDYVNLSKQIRKQLIKLTVARPIKKGIDSNGDNTERIQNTSVFRYPVDSIAEQLTLIETDIYMRPYEVLNQSWSKKDAAITSPNILALSRRFNAVAHWLSESILEPTTPKARAERISKVIDIGCALSKLNNYSTLMAVIAALNKAAVSRLKLSFKEVSSRQLQKKLDLEKIMAPLGSYKMYRHIIQTARPPCIPYIGTTLTDLTYTDDGNPDIIDGLINFPKHEQTAKLIRDLLQYQQSQHSFKPVPDLFAFLQRLPEATAQKEKDLWVLSKSME